ncbi:hypothetical protein BN77_1318 [Rhizobium mesoamericanum STM3625]|uniref:Uncharacterized protein n=1 Tax=Rhizobium mesoamericanum STM3625 TaxID=1211777 RepID=K0PS69_9HYPH|nr:hypothetical protein BN77_1318 [Rhizobium mesoamericanum STM3625]
MAALANKLGWLVGTLHLFKHRGVRPFLNLHILQGALFFERARLTKALYDRTCRGLYG